MTNRRLRGCWWERAALVVAMLAAGLAVVQGNRAEDERATAEAQARDLALQELVARANVLDTTKRDLAALLAVAAYEVDPSVETYGGLVAAFTSAPSYERTIPLDEPSSAGALVAPDGHTLFVIDGEQGVASIDLRNGGRREVLDGVQQPAGGPPAVALSPDGGRLARLSANVTGTPCSRSRRSTPASRRSPRSGSRSRRAPSRTAPTATSWRWAAARGGPWRYVRPPTAASSTPCPACPARGRLDENGRTVALTFLPTGRLAITTQAGPLRIIEPGSGRELARYPGPPETASYVAASSADGRVVVGHSVNGLAAWDVEAGELLWTVRPTPSATRSSSPTRWARSCAGARMGECGPTTWRPER